MPFRPPKGYKPSIRYFKYLIYNTLIYKNNTINTFTSLEKLEFILRIFDINLKLSSKSKQDAYIRNLIRKSRKNRYKLKLLLVLRLSLIKKVYFEKNLALALKGKLKS
jgi:hypothetical protein